jgi:polar amino acid transport system substrate-binding protein
MLLLYAVPRRIALLTCCAAVAASSVLLTACGSDDSTSKAKAASTPAETTAASTPAPTAAAETVKIGVDPTTMPYGGKKDGALTGMDNDVAQAMAKQAGVTGDISELTFDNAVPALKSGRAQVSFVGGWFDSPERRAEMNIIGYYTAAVGFVTKDGGPKVGATWDGRCGLTLATYSSSPSYIKILKDDSAKCTKAGKDAITIKTFAGLAQGVLAVRSGRIAGMLDAVPAVAYQAHAASGLSFVQVSDQPAITWGIGVDKKDTALAQKLATALEAVRQSGDLAAIWKKYGLPDSMNVDHVTLNGKPV